MRRVIRKFISTLGLSLFILLATRAVVRFIPGDPLDSILMETGTSMSREALAQELGLDRAFFPAAAEDLRRMMKGDLGISLITRKPISAELPHRIGSTLRLAVTTLLVCLPLSLALGVTAASYRAGNPSLLGRASDTLSSLFGAVGPSLPAFWLGPSLAYFFAVLLPWFDLSGGLALAVFTLSIPIIGSWSRLIRLRTQQTLAEPFAIAARARGLSEGVIAWRYGWRPAAGAIASFLGSQSGALLAGSFLVETLFDRPGLGSYLVEAVLRRDYPTVETAAGVGATLILFANLIGDGFQNLLDPRLEQNANLKPQSAGRVRVR